jgi:hypothetical protein
MSYRSISDWFDSLGTDPVPRAPLPGDLEVTSTALRSTRAAINASADRIENRTGRRARLHDRALRLLGANLEY